MNAAFKLFGALAIFALSGGSCRGETVEYAQPEAEQSVQHVELIIFKHRYPQQSADNLYQMQDDTLAGLPRAQQVFIRIAATPIEIYRPSHEVSPIYDYDKYLLHRQMRNLHISDTVEVLHHVAWIQPPYDDHAIYVNLLAEQTNGLIDGVARLKTKRYNHLEVKLYYDLGAFGTADIAIDTSADARPLPSSQILELDFSGVARTGQLLYLDHSVLGILAFVKSMTRSQIESSSPVDTLNRP